MVGPDDVCVTGMAWSTPLGDTLDGAWDRLVAGHGGLTDAPCPFPVRNALAGVVPTAPADWTATRRQVAMAAATMAAGFADAGVAPTDPGVEVVLGTSFGPLLDEPAAAADEWALDAARAIGFPGRPAPVTTACSAGADAIALGAELVRSGRAGICVAGGVDVLTPGKRLGHSALGTLSPDLLRAFDERHDGTVLGEGAAVLVLERGSSALRRGARVWGVLRGAGSANDATGLTAPDPSGRSVVLAVRRSLAAAGRSAADVAVVNAHATGTPVNDAVESASLGALFADVRRPPVVFATKGALGHSLGATGAIEAVSVLLALRAGVAPPVFGVDSPLKAFPLPLALAATPFTGDLGASLTIGFGGFNTCLLFERVAA